MNPLYTWNEFYTTRNGMLRDSSRWDTEAKAGGNGIFVHGGSVNLHSTLILDNYNNIGHGGGICRFACRSSWQNRAFDVGGGYRLAVMAWSDNLYAFGRSLEDAVSILSDWADALYACAGYEIKPDSLEATTSSTKRSPERTFFWQGRAWKVRDHLTCLGYTISSVGDIARCKTKFIQELHGCF